MGTNEIEREVGYRESGENIETMKWDGYKEVNVVRRYKEHVNVSITQKIPKLRHPHTKGPLSQV